MVISGSQHPLKVDYRIPKYIIQLWVNKILVVVVVVVVVRAAFLVYWTLVMPM